MKKFWGDGGIIKGKTMGGWAVGDRVRGETTSGNIFYNGFVEKIVFKLADTKDYLVDIWAEDLGAFVICRASQITYTNDRCPVEWLDVLKVDGGNGKYPKGSWKEPDGATMSFKDTHSAMFRHLAESYAGNRIDDGTQLDHLLSVAFRALAMYTRIKRRIKHPQDE